jgi:hypothetical protein
MLENQKTIILSLINNRTLFTRELVKSYVWLDQQEIKDLEQWVIANFWDSHEMEITEAFNQIFE